MAAGDESWLQTTGARLGDRGGRRGAVSFADPAAEAVAATSGAAVVPLAGFAAFEAAGRDARAFLHRMLTQDVRSLAAGAGRPALLLDARGRILGDPFVWCLADRFVLASEPAAARGAVPTLERFVIADDVTLTDVSSAWAHAVVLGPAAPATVEGARAALAAAGALAARWDGRGLPAFRLLVPAAGLSAVLRALVTAGGTLAGESAFDVARVVAGIPWWGAEVDDRVIPNEAGLDAAVSRTKGCYPGQEPVLMARHRGHPPSLLVRLSVPGEGTPEPGTALRQGDQVVGRLTTVVRTGTPPAVVALAYVRHSDARAGVRLAVEGSASPATVEEVLAS